MSTHLASKPLTIPQRTAAALSQASELLAADDAKRLNAALMEVAVEELAHNTRFAEQVRQHYEALAPRRPVPTTPRGKTTKGTQPVDVELVPLKRLDSYQVSLIGPIDPYMLYEVYGLHQLALALGQYSLKKLQGASAMVEARNPGTRPAKKTDKAAIIEYIVAHVAEPGQLKPHD
jgi:hypothetical protein